MNYLIIFLLVFFFITYCNAKKIRFFAKYGFWPNKKRVILPFRKKNGRLYLADEKLSEFFINYSCLDLQISEKFTDVNIYLPVEISSRLFRKNRMKLMDCASCKVVYIFGNHIFYIYKKYSGKYSNSCPDMIFDIKSASFINYKEEDLTSSLMISEATQNYKEKDIFFLDVKEGVIYPYK